MAAGNDGLQRRERGAISQRNKRPLLHVSNRAHPTIDDNITGRFIGLPLEEASDGSPLRRDLVVGAGVVETAQQPRPWSANMAEGVGSHCGMASLKVEEDGREGVGSCPLPGGWRFHGIQSEVFAKLQGATRLLRKTRIFF